MSANGPRWSVFVATDNGPTLHDLSAGLWTIYLGKQSAADWVALQMALVRGKDGLAHGLHAGSSDDFESKVLSATVLTHGAHRCSCFRGPLATAMTHRLTAALVADIIRVPHDGRIVRVDDARKPR